MKLKRMLARIAGIVLLVAGIAGLAFSIAALVLLGPLERKVEATATEQLALIDEALTTTADGLAVASTSLSRASVAIGSVEGTLGGVGQTINGTVPVLNSVTELLGEKLPATLETTQDTLRSVASSARLVDDVLAIVTTLPFLDLDVYNPDVPLFQGFEQMADSLGRIPESLSEAHDGLESTVGHIEQVEGDFASMADNVGGIVTDLEDAQSVIVQYQEIVSEVQGTISSARQSLPTWLRLLRWGLSLMLIWLGIAQIGLLTQGWELIERSRVTPAASTQ
jgi:methyl-accepting chemotaxis protein